MSILWDGQQCSHKVGISQSKKSCDRAAVAVDGTSEAIAELKNPPEIEISGGIYIIYIIIHIIIEAVVV